MGSLTILTTGIVALWGLAALVLTLALATRAIEFVRENRPVRLARHESIQTYYFKGHAFAH